LSKNSNISVKSNIEKNYHVQLWYVWKIIGIFIVETFG